MGLCRLLAGVWAVQALQADEQTHIHDPAENPLYPSEDFLVRLERPHTLIYADTQVRLQSHKGFLEYLENEGHKLTVLTGSKSIPSQETFDSVIVLAHEILPAMREYVISHFDLQWLLPFMRSRDQDTSSSLPPSVIILADQDCLEVDHCAMSKSSGSPNSELAKLAVELGMSINVHSQGQNTSKDRKMAPIERNTALEVASTSLSTLGSDLSSALRELVGSKKTTGRPHLVDERNAHTRALVTPPASSPIAPGKMASVDILRGESVKNMDQKQRRLKPSSISSAVSTMAGERGWNRALFSTLPYVCEAVSANEVSQFCRHILDWATHRRDVSTWSNLQHYRISSPRTWSEFEGALQKETWSLQDLQNTDMNRPYLYTIRDEILVALDLYDLRRQSNGTFTWETHADQPFVELEYAMMVPYVRKLMLPSADKRQSTPLLRALYEVYHTSGPLREAQELLPLKVSSATHWAHFKAPVQHGIFKIVLKSIESETPIDLETLVPLRTYKHDEGPRFIPRGFPYYVTLLVSTVAFGCVSAMWPTAVISRRKRDSRQGGELVGQVPAEGSGSVRRRQH